jgi:hypothetical protein
MYCGRSALTALLPTLLLTRSFKPQSLATRGIEQSYGLLCTVGESLTSINQVEALMFGYAISHEKGRAKPFREAVYQRGERRSQLTCCQWSGLLLVEQKILHSNHAPDLSLVGSSVNGVGGVQPPERFQGTPPIGRGQQLLVVAALTNYAEWQVIDGLF